MALNEWLILQIADSAFPAGSFAHSGALEAAWQHARLTRGTSLAEFLRSQLNQTAHAGAPFVAAAHLHSDQFDEWDSLLHAMLSNHVANRASRSQGQAFLLAASRVFSCDALNQLASRLRQEGGYGHFAPVFGFLCAALEVQQEACIRLFLFLTLRGLVSAAVRLGIAGPLEGQTLQFRLSGYAEDLVHAVLLSSVENAAQTAPLLDLMQGTHDRLYSRLFQS